ncbi:hypothetical protein WA538_003420, partial [Blastocystis sp. DL]
MDWPSSYDQSTLREEHSEFHRSLLGTQSNLFDRPISVTSSLGCMKTTGSRYESLLSVSKQYYLFEIQFKRSSRLCMGSEEDAVIDIGDYVYVTGDRGVDLGHVINRKTCLSPPSHQPMPLVLNKASPLEVSLLKDQRREEMYVLRLCCQKAQQQNLGIVIVDVEFQYDRKKLTVYYYCNGRIDFRGFVKELYSIFYARIWMENIKNRGIGDKG